MLINKFEISDDINIIVKVKPTISKPFGYLDLHKKLIVLNVPDKFNRKNSLNKIIQDTVFIDQGNNLFGSRNNEIKLAKYILTDKDMVRAYGLGDCSLNYCLNHKPTSFWNKIISSTLQFYYEKKFCSKCHRKLEGLGAFKSYN